MPPGDCEKRRRERRCGKRFAAIPPSNQSHKDRSFRASSAFHKAFGCKEGDPMVRPKEQQCEVW